MMADQIHAVPANMRAAAAHHQETSEHLRTVPSTHEAIQECLDSLGPIFGELREAGRELLEQRRQCYLLQADDHADMTQNLTISAELWKEQDVESARTLGGIADEGR